MSILTRMRWLAFAIVLTTALQPIEIFAQIITVYDSGGAAHSVNTDTDCTQTSQVCDSYSNGRCVNYHLTYDCKGIKPDTCVKWTTSTQCAQFQGPNNGTGEDFTSAFGAGLSAVAAGAEINNVFLAKSDACKKSLICNECKGEPDSGLTKIMGAAAMISAAAKISISLAKAAASVSTWAVGTGGTAATIADSLASSWVGTLAGAAPYIAIAVVVITYILNATCHPTKLNGYAKWLGKSAHNLGRFCSKKILGFCIQHTTSFCVYDNKFSYVLAREIKKQLGKPWPAPNPIPTDADCNNIYLSDLSLVDFSKMNLSDIFGDLQTNAQKTNYDPGLVGNKIDQFYNSGVTQPTSLDNPPPPTPANANAQAANYDPNIHAQMTASGWSGSAPPPSNQPGLSNLSAVCAETPQNQINYAKNTLFAGKTVNQVRADLIAQMTSLNPPIPPCDPTANPPTTMQTDFCYDPVAINNATMDELAALAMRAMCDFQPI